MVCVFCLSWESNSKKGVVVDDEDGIGRNKVVICFLSILLVLVAAMLMSIKHIVIRIFKGQYSGFDQAVDSAILEGAFMGIFLFPLVKTTEFTL